MRYYNLEARMNIASLKYRVSAEEWQLRVDLAADGTGAAFVWPSLLRKLDRTDSSYKD
jgi:hypothetical protein